MCIYVHRYVHTHVFTCMLKRIRTYMYTYIYMRTYVYVYIYTHIHTLCLWYTMHMSSYTCACGFRTHGLMGIRSLVAVRICMSGPARRTSRTAATRRSPGTKSSSHLKGEHTCTYIYIYTRITCSLLCCISNINKGFNKGIQGSLKGILGFLCKEYGSFAAGVRRVWN